jgi:hypothetical protein
MSVEDAVPAESPRYKVGLKRGWIERRDGSRTPCNLLEVSDRGARLNAVMPIGSKFVLSLSQDGKVARICKVIWQKETQTGVLFLAKRKPQSTPSVTVEVD